MRTWCSKKGVWGLTGHSVTSSQHLPLTGSIQSKGLSPPYWRDAAVAPPPPESPRMSRVFLALSLLTFSVHAQVQVERSERPNVLALDDVALTQVQRPDLDAVRAEDLAREEAGLAPRYAVSNEVSITPSNHGTWENLEDGRLLWRLRVQAPQARSINLGFGRYFMPEDGRLFVYSADQTQIVRPFTAADNEDHGELWTPVLATEELVVELEISMASLDQLQLELVHIGYGYRGFGSSDEDPNEESGSCNVDVICPQGDLWRMEIPAIGVISLGGGTFCTGFLVNNVRQDQRPYFMTARHCGVASGNAASLVVFWNYENSFCRTPGSAQSGQVGNGSFSQFNTGSIWRSAYSPSDFTLVELDDPLNPAHNLTFAGWNATGNDATSAVAIHHPNTQEKRISFENQATTTTSYLSNAVPGNGTHVRVIDWDLGTTEGGSSGSPLFNQNHQVIGQLHGGFASCSSQTSDWYGKFSVSWTGGGGSANSLRPWLDPDNTGTLQMPTLGSACPSTSLSVLNGSGVNPTCLTSVTTPVIGGAWQIGVDSSVVSGATFSAVLLYSGGTSGVFTGLGEILIDLTSNRLTSSNITSTGGVDIHTINIPNNPFLAGFTFHAQAAVGAGALPNVVCNSLMVTLGCTP